MKLYHTQESIMISDWPIYKETWNFDEEESNIEQLKEIIVGIRNLRTVQNIHPSKKSDLIFVTTKLRDMIIADEAMIKKLGFANQIKVIKEKGEIENSTSIVVKDAEVIIPLGDLIDKEAEKERLESEIKKLTSEVERASKMLSNQGFISKAPASKIEEEKEKLAKYEELLKMAKENLEKFAK